METANQLSLEKDWPSMKKGRRHLFIPDMQVTPETPTDHLDWIGRYIVSAQPDVIVCIGDFADMESLSSYDKGKKSFEGRRYLKDISAANAAMKVMMAPINKHNKQRLKRKVKQWKPQMVMTLGNHEHRINRAVQNDATLSGVLSTDHLNYAGQGWQVIPFLDVIEIDGVHYSHYFSNPMTGKPYGGTSIDTRLKTVGFSFSMGHQQTYITGQRFLNNGARLRGLVCGAGYLHSEDYIGAQGNTEWRGILVKNEVSNGSYDLTEVSLDYLCRKYEKKPLWLFMEQNYPEIFASSTRYHRQKKEQTDEA